MIEELFVCQEIKRKLKPASSSCIQGRNEYLQPDKKVGLAVTLLSWSLAQTGTMPGVSSSNWAIRCSSSQSLSHFEIFLSNTTKSKFTSHNNVCSLKIKTVKVPVEIAAFLQAGCHFAIKSIDPRTRGTLIQVWTTQTSASKWNNFYSL